MYTDEEYRNVLNVIYGMSCEVRKEAFGVNKCFSDYIKDFPASELIEKYREYINTPKPGEYWRKKEDGQMVVVWFVDVEEDTIFICYCDGGYGIYSLKYYFVDNFTKSEYKSQYLELFIKEMEKMNK